MPVPHPELAARPLNVTDALSYLDAVKVQFQDKPDVYNHFLDIMKDFKSEVIDTPGVIERVSMLFHGNPSLIQGFNTFLPHGYRIDVSADPRDPNAIRVTTPSGTTTQSTQKPSYLPSRAITPYQPLDTFSLGLPPSSTTAAASFLGGLGARNALDSNPPGEFNHAIKYLNKIKACYADDPDTYKQFLEILQTYQKEQRHRHDSQVYAQVQVLFKDAPELLAEFKDFLPEASMAFAAPGGVASILPQPTLGPAHSAQWSDMDKDKIGKKPLVAPPKKRRKAPEKDLTPVPSSRSIVSRAKRPKHTHKLGEPDSPHYSSYALPPPSPPHPATLPQSHVMPPPPLPHMAMLPPLMNVPHHAIQTPPDELLFFERAKRTLESRDTYEEFLKLLTLYSKDIIDAKTLVDLSQAFLGDGDLLAQFKEVLRVDELQSNVEHGPPGSIRTGPPEPLPALPADEGEGPSYRRLPESEVNLACSSRDELCRSVLNDIWVSHPTWASEEVGFISHKKNSFEEALHKSEEERHEYHVQLEALARTITLFEPLSTRIEEMTNEERATFRLKADFGGSNRSIYHRTLKKVYGRDAGPEVIQALQDCPSVAVPVVLARLKAKDEEWRRIQREWNKAWRDIDAKNFYKSLDHQGNQFKQNDKKHITAKHFVQHIEGIKEAQEHKFAERGRPSFAAGSVGYQLEFDFPQTSVLHDSLRLVYSFLDHSQAQYSPAERRAIEGFLCQFVPLLYMFPAHEFDAACGPSAGIQDDELEHEALNNSRSGSRSAAGPSTATGELRKPLFRSSPEKSPANDVKDVVSMVPILPRSHGSSNPRCGSSDVWIHTTQACTSSDGTPRGRPFFANTTIYTLLCLLQLIYSRLVTCKDEGAKHVTENLNSMDSNPIAVELGLDDPNGPGAVLRQAMEALGEQRPDSIPDLVYMYFIDACEKLFDGELEVGLFEEHMRWFFGNQAYLLFTLDKLIAAFIKQVQSVLSDNKSQELWAMLQEARRTERLTNQDMIRYRREAERHVGPDEHLYRIEWDPQSKKMMIQLLEGHDPSAEVDRSAMGRWHEYVDSYVLRHPTEWIPEHKEVEGSAVFLRRWVSFRDVIRSLNWCDKNRSLSTDDAIVGWSDVRIRISLRTYKLVCEAGSEDAFVQRRSREEEKEVQERARRRNEERGRCRLLVGLGGN
ncbi:hypothetical protein EV363DRAFT_1152523 [Boletus edulis]|nr:hypothetical protein EV363DRAFT_1152523 [Boletus edulis]